MGAWIGGRIGWRPIFWLPPWSPPGKLSTGVFHSFLALGGDQVATSCFWLPPTLNGDIATFAGIQQKAWVATNFSGRHLLKWLDSNVYWMVGGDQLKKTVVNNSIAVFRLIRLTYRDFHIGASYIEKMVWLPPDHEKPNWTGEIQ